MADTPRSQSALQTLAADNQTQSISAQDLRDIIVSMWNNVDDPNLLDSSSSLNAANLTGTLPAISGANLTSLTAGNLTGTLPAISGANLTSLTAANLSGNVPTANLTTNAIVKTPSGVQTIMTSGVNTTLQIQGSATSGSSSQLFLNDHSGNNKIRLNGNSTSNGVITFYGSSSEIETDNGSLNIEVNGSSKNLVLSTTGTGGSIQVNTALSGTITLSTSAGAAATGGLSFSSGMSSTLDSGSLSFSSGASPSQSGDISFSTGDSDAGNTGNISFSTGDGESGTSGSIILTANTNGSADSGRIVLSGKLVPVITEGDVDSIQSQYISVYDDAGSLVGAIPLYSIAE
jgi:hypothetical protein